MTYEAGAIPTTEELVSLYDSVGWLAYTRCPQVLSDGVAHSLYVVTARDRAGHLVGLARVVGDGYTIAYLQDVLVHPDMQRQGVGRELVTRVFAPFMHCRQHVLTTDTQMRQRALYESLGFVETRDWPEGEQTRSFMRLNDSEAG